MEDAFDLWDAVSVVGGFGAGQDTEVNSSAPGAGAAVRVRSSENTLGP